MARKRADRTKKNILSVTDATYQPLHESSETHASPGKGRGSRWLVVGVVAFLTLGTLGAGLKYLDDKGRADGNVSVNEQSFMSSLNPFASMPSPSPTPQLSKEYLYAGQRLLAVEDKNATAIPPADLAIWRPSDGTWYVHNPANGAAWTTQPWGEDGPLRINLFRAITTATERRTSQSGAPPTTRGM